MDHPKCIVSNQKEKSISIQSVKYHFVFNPPMLFYTQGIWARVLSVDAD